MSGNKASRDRPPSAPRTSASTPFRWVKVLTACLILLTLPSSTRPSSFKNPAGQRGSETCDSGWESVLCTASDASAPKGRNKGVFSHDWSGDTSTLQDWLVERELYYSDGIVRGIPCASWAEGCTGADRMSSEEHEYGPCYAKLLEDHRRLWTHQHYPFCC